jgi:hypothetical protein
MVSNGSEHCGLDGDLYSFTEFWMVAYEAYKKFTLFHTFSHFSTPRPNRNRSIRILVHCY